MEGYHGIGGISLDSPRHCDWIPGSCGMTNFSGAKNGKNWEIYLLERLVNRSILLEFHTGISFTGISHYFFFVNMLLAC